MSTKTLLVALSLTAAIVAQAQTAREDLERDIHLSASNYLAYPGPRHKLTPPPKGMKPFYISHYGRHGSRFLSNQREYDYPYLALQRADSLNKLTALGREVYQRVAKLRSEAEGRLGELTPLGVQQHRQIARRMYERFPEVFEGDANIDARSTTVIRCVLSMESALQQFAALNPKLHITHDASRRDMYYMNQNDPTLTNKKMPTKVQQIFNDFCDIKEKPERLMKALFNDTAYVSHHVNARRLNYQLFKLASNVQSTEMRRQLSLYDIFTDEEVFNNWEKENAWWYINYGPSPLNGGTQPYSQRNLLRTIIAQADSCIKLPKPGATLRYGHDTMVMPLCCLLDLNGYGQQVTELEDIVRIGWYNYRIFPMACNIQFVFYRKQYGDKDILFKVLLNEDEATLPLKSSHEPYYLWEDFRDYYLSKLNDYDAPIKP